MTDARRYSEYRASDVYWLGDLPKHWEVRRIKTIFRELKDRSGGTHGELLSLTKSNGLIPRARLLGQKVRVADTSNYKRCRPGHLVMNRMQAWSGMFAVSRQEGLVSPEYSVFELIHPSNVRYFEFLFKTPVFVQQFSEKSKGVGSGFNRLYTPVFGNIPSILPPPREQDAIVQFLDCVDQRTRRYVDAKRRLVGLLEEERQAVVNQAVTRGLDPNVRLKPSGVEWIGDTPEHWEITRVGHFARVTNGSTPSRSNHSYWTDGTHAWLNSSSVNQGTITHAEQFVTDLAMRECHLPRLRPGSVLVGITGQGKTRGMSAVLSIEATINQHMASITPNTRRVSSRYLHMFLTAAYDELRAISSASGSTKAALTCEDVKHFKVVLPSTDEQKQILSYANRKLEVVTDAINRARRQAELVQEYRTRLVADVVTGKLDVREAAAKWP